MLDRKIGETLFRGDLKLNTYESKWDTESTEYVDSPLDYRTVIDAALREQLLAVARGSWHAASADGYLRVDQQMDRILPLLRPPARALVSEVGYLSGRHKAGQPMARVADGWCVFFNRGCVLHSLGEAEGDSFRYKPAICAAFPLAIDDGGRWYVRQKGYQGEIWELPCLDPDASAVPAATSLRAEIALVQSWQVDT